MTTETEQEQESNQSSTTTSEDIYNWSLPFSVLKTINGIEYEFNNVKNPYDLGEIITDSWVESCIAKQYFLPIESDDN